MPHGLNDRRIIRAATLSSCGRYRYSLTRQWDRRQPSVTFVGLNPSTADAERDDPTIRRLIGFAEQWGFGKLIVVNLFAYRSPHPRILFAADDPTGNRSRRRNDTTIRRAVRGASRTVVMWGGDRRAATRADEVMRLLRHSDLYCFGRTESGAPRHPLHLPYATELETFAP